MTKSLKEKNRLTEIKNNSSILKPSDIKVKLTYVDKALKSYSSYFKFEDHYKYYDGVITKQILNPFFKNHINHMLLNIAKTINIYEFKVGVHFEHGMQGFYDFRLMLMNYSGEYIGDLVLKNNYVNDSCNNFMYDLNFNDKPEDNIKKVLKKLLVIKDLELQLVSDTYATNDNIISDRFSIISDRFSFLNKKYSNENILRKNSYQIRKTLANNFIQEISKKQYITIQFKIFYSDKAQWQIVNPVDYREEITSGIMDISNLSLVNVLLGLKQSEIIKVDIPDEDFVEENIESIIKTIRMMIY